ncbi:MAG: hypothetical protein LBI72_14175 [Flavobacteriaceae bacterium]|nr:hypothetical protein [Flavobacteriaceae bacterium]
MILVNKYLVPKGYGGITLFPFIFLRDSSFKEDAVFINHERIHLRQQLELLLIGFYIVYIFSFVYYLIKGNTYNKAYRLIVFEREAYQFEADLSYLKKRSFMAFCKW